MKTGELIRKYRKEKKLTMKELGEKVGVSEQAISQYERGARKVNLETLIKIGEVLNVTLNDLNDKKELSPIQLLLKQEILDKGFTFRDLSKQVGVPESEINEIYECGNVTQIKYFFDLFKFFGIDDQTIMNNIILHYKINSIYNNDASDPMMVKLRKLFLNEPLSMNELLLGVEDFDDDNFVEYLFRLGNIYNSDENTHNKKNNNELDILEDLLDKETTIELFKDKLEEINRLKPLLAYHGFEFSINKDKSIDVSIPKYDIYSTLDLDLFIDFINKISWSIDREIDYLKDTYFK